MGLLEARRGILYVEGYMSDRKRALDAASERERVDHWMEVEYDVAIFWRFEATSAKDGFLATRAVLEAVPLPWAAYPDGRFSVSDILRCDTPVLKQENLFRLLQSKLMMDLQIAKVYGTASAEYFKAA